MDQYNDITGYWKSYRVGYENNDPGLIKVAVDSSGRLMQSVIYDASVHCRIWLNDYDITYKDGSLTFWGDEFAGTMSEDKQTVRLMYNNRFGDDIPFVWQRVSDSTFISLLDIIETSRGSEYEYQVPPLMDDGLEVAGLSDVLIVKEKIIAAVQCVIEKQTRDIHSLLLIKDGKLVLEEYFGADGVIHGSGFNDIFRNRPQQLASVTKSVNSLLVGMALEQGYLEDIETPVYTFFPEYKDCFTGKKQDITIRHLLIMSSGLRWNENTISFSDNRNDAAQLHRAEDIIRFIIEKPLDSDPGTVFSYNSGLSVLLGEIVRRATGMGADAFAEKYLFSRLDIDNYSWSHSSNGILQTDGGLALRSRDMAKIGLLYLNRGRWRNRQVVREAWIKESAASQISRGNGGYGYQVWMRTYAENTGEYRAYYAIGNYGQFIMVFPALDLIIVSTAQDYKRGWFSRFNRLVSDYILPAVSDNKE